MKALTITSWFFVKKLINVIKSIDASNNLEISNAEKTSALAKSTIAKTVKKKERKKKKSEMQ
jgi:hypothetical protein